MPDSEAGKHARRRAAPRAAAANRTAAAAARGPAPAPSAGARSPYRRPRGRAGAFGAGFGVGRILPRGNEGQTGHLLTAQLLTGAVIVAIRAVGDYQLTDSGTTRGTLNTPGNGGYGPFTILAGLIGSFFALSFLAAAGGRRAKAAVAFGFLIVTVLMIKSMDEIEIVAGFITADPASRTVTAAAFSSSATQPWGAAAQVPDPTQAVDLTAAFTGAGASSSSSAAAFFGTPFALGSSAGAATAGGGTASSAAGAAPSSVPLNPTSSFPTVNPGGSITPGN